MTSWTKTDEEIASKESDDRDHRIEHQRNECRGNHPGHHQGLNGVDADNPHRVDLVANRPGAQISAHRGGPCAGDDDGGDHRTHLRDRCQRCTCTRQVACADLDQHDVQREDDEHRVGNGEHERRDDRYPRDEPDLLDQLAPGERPAKHRGKRLAGSTTKSPTRDGGLRPGDPRHGRRPRDCGTGLPYSPTGRRDDDRGFVSVVRAHCITGRKCIPIVGQLGQDVHKTRSVSCQHNWMRRRQ